MISTKNVKVNFKTLQIDFEDYTFSKNRISVIIGRNGTGKTTFLKALASLIPYEGEVLVDGTITYNSQEPVLFNRSVYDNIVYPLKIRQKDISKYSETITEYAKVLHIEHLLNNNALKLSSGEKMKVSIIRSIIFHPDAVILDEPTTHLDLESIEELILLIKKLKKDITFIIVSHNKSFIDKLADDYYTIGGSYVYR